MAQAAQPEWTAADVLSQLREAQQAGLSFGEARQKLLAQGVGEELVNTVTDGFDYEPKRSVPDAPNKVATYFAAHPEEAQADADSLLKAKRTEDAADARNQAMLDAGAAWGAGRLGVQGLDAKTEYESRFAFDVDAPFWGLFLGQILLNAGVFVVLHQFGMNKWLYAVNGLLALGLVVWLIKRIK